MAGRIAAGRGLAITYKMQVQQPTKTFCNFMQKRLAKNISELEEGENGKKFDFLVKPRAIVMGRNIERNLDFRDRVREYSSKSGIRLLKAQDIKK